MVGASERIRINSAKSRLKLLWNLSVVTNQVPIVVQRRKKQKIADRREHLLKLFIAKGRGDREKIEKLIRGLYIRLLKVTQN